MIEELEGSHDDRLGFAVSGTVDKSDYEVLTPAVQRAVDAFGSVRLVLDMRGFHCLRATTGAGSMCAQPTWMRSFSTDAHRA